MSLSYTAEVVVACTFVQSWPVRGSVPLSPRLLRAVSMRVVSAPPGERRTTRNVARIGLEHDRQSIRCPWLRELRFKPERVVRHDWSNGKIDDRIGIAGVCEPD